jgi:hypothetical protein
VIESTVYSAFAEALNTFATQHSPPLAVAYPGVHFEPPSTGLWLEMRWFPNTTRDYGVGNEGPSLHQGIGQVSVHGNAGAGVPPMIELADEVIAAFSKGTTLGPGIVDRKPWQSAVLIEGGQVIVPVTVRWKAFV